ncbi:MAG: ribosome-associated translation inhibitor RaiA [Halobacteriovoraceae bacterium]|nr:ribosome-associated translation inhibitor RaiA [Halobacteriovoraceae bacterium]
MKFVISFRHMEHTPALDELIKSKSQKLEKFIKDENAELHWTCWVENKTQIAELTLRNHKQDFAAKAQTEDLYKSVDEVIKKMDKQLSGQHDKFQH